MHYKETDEKNRLSTLNNSVFVLLILKADVLLIELVSMYCPYSLPSFCRPGEFDVEGTGW